MDVTLREEQPADRSAIAEVHRRAFGQEAEGRLVDALRDGGWARLSLLAEDGDQVIGHILFSELTIEGASGTVAALALAPVAVVPERQRQGVGTRLVERGLRLCAERGHRIAIVLGEPAFYTRFGFSAELAEPLASPYAGPAFQALALAPGALEGVAGEVHYAPPFENL